MARGEQLQRQWEMLRVLQTRGEGIPLRELSERFGVSERTIQRDLEALQELGFPIEHEEIEYNKRYWRMPHDFFRSGPLTIGLTEAISLHLAEEMFTPLAGTHLAEGLRSLLEKIRKTIPRAAMEHFAKLDQTLHVRRAARTDYSSKAEVLQRLHDAIRASTCVEISYHGLWRDEEYTTRCDPYGLVLYDDDLFLVGHSHRADALRVFKVARIRDAVATSQRFERPDDFRLEDQFRTSFGIMQAMGDPVEIAVRFTGAGAALVEERVWHETQQLAWLDGENLLFEREAVAAGALVATFRLSDVVEFKRWILGFGPLAEVLRPDWLRREISGDLAQTAARYAK